MPADNATRANVTVSLRDLGGAPFPNQNVTLSAAATAWPSLGVTLATDANGNATYPLVSFMAGKKLVSAHTAGLTLDTNVGFSSVATACTSPFIGHVPFIVGPASVSDVAVLDLNADANMDIVMTDPNNGNLYVALGQGNGLFNQPVGYSAGLGAGQIAQCDVNGDSNTDLVTVNVGAGSISCYVGTGTGTLAAAVTTPLTGAAMTNGGIACKDINNDGKVDVVVSDSAAKTVTVLLGSGSCNYSVTSTTTTSARPYALSVKDVTGDANLDIVYPGSNAKVYLMTGAGDGTFPATATFMAASNDQRVITTDFNLDGNMDIATGSIMPTNAASILLGTGGGNFGPTTSVLFPGANLRSLRSGDFNADGVPDLLVAGNTAQNVAIAMGAGDGTFGAPRYFLESLLPLSSAAADINRDGKLDVVSVVTSFNAGQGAHVMFGNGDGTLQDFSIDSNLTQLTLVAQGDVTGDGNVDIVAYTGSKALAVYVNRGDATFSTPSTYTLSDVANSVQPIDLNFDGALDVVASYGSATGGVAVLLNNGSGTFGAATVYPAGGYNAAVVLDDFDGDGLLDAIACNSNGSTVSMLKGAGGGALGAATSITAGGASSNPQLLASTDLNLDAKQDLVFGFAGTMQIATLLGNGDGSFAAPVTVATSAVVNGLSVVDSNLDGFPDVFASTSDGNVTLFLNAGNGTLSAAYAVPVARALYSMTVGDMNGDGFADVVADLVEDGAAEILFGNASGTLTHPLMYPMYNAPVSFTLADLNKDGHMDLASASNGSLTMHLYMRLPLAKMSA